jgi:3-oxoacyl-[acyl-carrier protein] reductase
VPAEFAGPAGLAGAAGFDGVVARVGGSRGGTFEQAARTVVFLFSDWATGVFGAHLPVDRAQNAPSPDGH